MAKFMVIAQRSVNHSATTVAIETDVAPEIGSEIVYRGMTLTVIRVF